MEELPREEKIKGIKLQNIWRVSPSKQLHCYERRSSMDEVGNEERQKHQDISNSLIDGLPCTTCIDDDNNYSTIDSDKREKRAFALTIKLPWAGHRRGCDVLAKTRVQENREQSISKEESVNLQWSHRVYLPAGSEEKGWTRDEEAFGVVRSIYRPSSTSIGLTRGGIYLADVQHTLRSSAVGRYWCGRLESLMAEKEKPLEEAIGHFWRSHRFDPWNFMNIYYDWSITSSFTTREINRVLP